MATNIPSKRKYPIIQPTYNPKSANASRKRAKYHDARSLAVQSTDAALSATGELDVAAYVGAREYEIRALETGIQKSKGALATRAFQKVPRALRRRTASHNVKRVPKRLRARAKRETLVLTQNKMIEDNTPTVTARRRKPTKILRIRLETARRLQSLNKKTKEKRAALKEKREKEAQSKSALEGSHTHTIAPRVPKVKKNKLSRPSPPVSKYRKRQRSKTWLPTHMFHAKRAHMTPPGEPLWRFAIPLTPTEKSYRPTHRAAGSRGAIAWDVSYMSTVQLEGKFAALENVLKSLRVEGDECWGSKGRKWRQGTRVLQKWVYEADENRKPIAPVTLIWCATAPKIEEDQEMSNAGDTSASRTQVRDKVFIRVHPSAFLQLWNVLLQVCKKQNPPVTLQDLRFDIGSIEIAGPGSTEALLATMRPVKLNEPDNEDNCHATTWKSLLGVTNPSSLPNGALLSFSISDPRLHYPVKTLKPSISESDMSNLATTLSSWAPDRYRNPPALFNRSLRLTASRRLPSQKAINRRRTLAGPGVSLKPQSTDPQIPVMVFASRLETGSKDSNSHGSWTVLLPWECVAPLWYVLMYYPLSSGDTPRFGGIKEQRQLTFEYGHPWFPGDYPGTRAGWEWNIREQEERKKEWEKRPKGKRVEFDSLDLGNGQKGEVGRGWACDWERIIQKMQSTVVDETQDTDSSGMKETTEPTESTQDVVPPLDIEYLRFDARTAAQLNANTRPWKFQKFPADKPYLATVKVTLMGRGTPNPCARIYRLPSKNDKLRKQWLATRSTPAKGSSNKKVSGANPSTKGKPKQNDPKDSKAQGEEFLQNLAASLVETSTDKPTSEISLPLEDDLIGFISSGNYNLTEGKGTGIGSIFVSKVAESHHSSTEPASKSYSQSTREKDLLERRVCIVRPAGERVGRLGVWEFV
ncbi:ribonuclease P complex subunit Pop1, putative [Talaromyces stipitatus ATCC 10500]|uniref:Ribonuclease P complex subunit Pop1, putative n=1 Tax=Talaromyces stipitatus (strain ATCC 10500 / CBS 375.48 / QM 6759 / NRRL 1006) TaxID=441959 RepID=B8M4R7_TALSN|nr:ribonuclease P complex subunit Pop1, putative [Talaromyces stipitatus ATCC 10500]EED19352.1 ribonuclease P complex subunit Pop1, putative [Talaromyces stipitatus ATCC 10500]